MTLLGLQKCLLRYFTDFVNASKYCTKRRQNVKTESTKTKISRHTVHKASLDFQNRTESSLSVWTGVSSTSI